MAGEANTDAQIHTYITGTTSWGFHCDYVKGRRAVLLKYNLHLHIIRVFTPVTGTITKVYYTHSSGFHGNYVNECALPARVAGYQPTSLIVISVKMCLRSVSLIVTVVTRLLHFNFMDHHHKQQQKQQQQRLQQQRYRQC
jgi:hypothetical protein